MSDIDDPTGARRRGLGRGLASLLGSSDENDLLARTPTTLPVELLHPSPFQPRRHFDEEQLDALSASVRQKGVMQPLVVRAGQEPGHYEIVAGERRWRAAQRAGLHDVPVVVKELSDSQALEIALIENLQREDLNALDEAHAYQRLIDQFGHTQEALAQVVGRSRSHVANILRLLALPEEVGRLIQEGRLSAGHARALIGTSDPLAAAREVIRGELSVRATEALVRDGGVRRGKRSEARPGTRNPNLNALERELSEAIGLPVTLKANSSGAGRMTIVYRTSDQLESLIDRLN